MSMNRGTVRVDFAGNRTEAKAFAKEQGLILYQHQGGEFPEVGMRYYSRLALERVQTKLAGLGWSHFEQQVVPAYRGS
jgi:hypothetical protein